MTAQEMKELNREHQNFYSEHTLKHKKETSHILKNSTRIAVEKTSERSLQQREYGTQGMKVSSAGVRSTQKLTTPTI